MKEQMEIEKFYSFFSAPRIGRYFTACLNDAERCINLYQVNLELAQAFHPLLGSFEVALRNGINDQLSVYFNDPDWIIHQQRGFMMDPSLRFIYKRTGKKSVNRFLFNAVKNAENTLIRKGVPITSGRMVAEQSFGFWTELFENHHYKILRGRPIQVFKYLPSGVGRSEVLCELTRIRKFRNRINHNEPICFSGQNIDFTPAMTVHQSLCNLLRWMHPDLYHWMSTLDVVEDAVRKGIQLYK